VKRTSKPSAYIFGFGGKSSLLREPSGAFSVSDLKKILLRFCEIEMKFRHFRVPGNIFCDFILVGYLRNLGLSQNGRFYESIYMKFTVS
jgi:hypothetical protein